MAHGSARAHTQTGVLGRTFLTRLFENEITAGVQDLKASFFWLVAFLAPLGILMPWAQVVEYEGIYLRGGAEQLRLLSMADKTLYLGFGLVATGIVTVITWHGLLVDRRDALVLGVLPVSGRVILRAKLIALGVYLGLVMIGMHAGASLSFGLILSRGSDLLFLVRGVAAHLVASCGASLFVMSGVIAAQGALLGAVGPRIFARLSPLLQVGVVAAVVGLLLALPAIAGGMVDAVQAGPAGSSWVLSTPPAWFLGVYEWILGTQNPVLEQLARTAALALTAVVGLALSLYPLASRRQLTAAVEGSAEGVGASPLVRVPDLIARALSRASVMRATVHFWLATLARVRTYRFLLAISGGTIVALALPGLLTLVTPPGDVPQSPSIAVLSIPVVVVTVVLVGLRVCASLPAELPAVWILSFLGAADREVKTGTRRTMYVLGVVPAVGLCWPLYGPTWGMSVAATHGLMCLSVGVVLTEALLWRFTGVPCTRPWHPERANLRMWWPAYLAAFVGLTRGVPRLTLWLGHSEGGIALVALGSFVAAIALRLTAAPPWHALVEEGEES